MKKVIEVRNLTKTYSVSLNNLYINVEKKTILKNLSFNVEENISLGILGASGVGKSTLVKILARLEEYDSGEIFIENRNIKDYKEKEFATKLQLLFQNSSMMLNPKLSIGFLIKERIKQYFNLYKLKFKNEDIELRLKELLDVAKLPWDITKMYSYQLSGGQKQRVAIILILALMPKILILDEPLSALDVALQAQMLNFFMELKEKYKFTYIFITHDRNLAEYFCDKILILYETGNYEII